MNLETLATNLSNEAPTPLMSKSNLIIMGYDEKGKNNLINFYIENVLEEDPQATVFYINNLDNECSHTRVALMEKHYTMTIDYLYHLFLIRKKNASASAQIYVVIRDLNDLIKDPLIKYHKEVEHSESFAMKINRLINEGYSCNINFILNVKNDQLPEQIKSGFLDYVFFKMNRSAEPEHAQIPISIIKKENQFIYCGNLFIITENHYPFKLKEEILAETELQKEIKKYTSKVLETDIKNLSNNNLVKHILIKLFCTYGAKTIEEPKYKMSEVSFNFSFRDKVYSVFLHNKTTKKELKSAIDLANKLEKTNEILLINVEDSEMDKEIVNGYHVLNKKDLIDLIKYKIDEDKMDDPDLKATINARLKFFSEPKTSKQSEVAAKT